MWLTAGGLDALCLTAPHPPDTHRAGDTVLSDRAARHPRSVALPLFAWKDLGLVRKDAASAGRSPLPAWSLNELASVLFAPVMVHRLRQLLLVLIAFAFVGGTSSQLARSVEYAAPMVMAGMPCDMMMAHAGMQDEKPIPPCKGMTPDCIKQMGCVANAALPARMLNFDIAVHFSDVNYWSAWSKLADFAREPEPLPPRTV